MGFFKKSGPVKRVYGWQPSLPDHRDVEFVGTMAVLPSSIDLRGIMPFVIDQGDVGCCTGCALSAALSVHLRGGPYAPMFIYYNERMLENKVDSDSGAGLRTGMKTLVKFGGACEFLWPLNSKLRARPNSKAYDDALTHRTTGYLAVRSLNATLSVLASSRPVAFGMSIFESFESDEVASSGIVPMPGQSEGNLGGHAVLAVGYDLDGRFLLCRNSWGEGWGNGGYFKLPFEYVESGLAQDFWMIK